MYIDGSILPEKSRHIIDIKWLRTYANSANYLVVSSDVIIVVLMIIIFQTIKYIVVVVSTICYVYIYTYTYYYTYIYYRHLCIHFFLNISLLTQGLYPLGAQQLAHSTRQNCAVQICVPSSATRGPAVGGRRKTTQRSGGGASACLVPGEWFLGWLLSLIERFEV